MTVVCQVLAQSRGRQEQDQLLLRAAWPGTVGSAGKSRFQKDGTPDPGPRGEEEQGQRYTGEQWAGCTRGEPQVPLNFEAGVQELQFRQS